MKNKNVKKKNNISTDFRLFTIPEWWLTNDFSYVFDFRDDVAQSYAQGILLNKANQRIGPNQLIIYGLHEIFGYRAVNGSLDQIDSREAFEEAKFYRSFFSIYEKETDYVDVPERVSGITISQDSSGDYNASISYSGGSYTNDHYHYTVFASRSFVTAYGELMRFGEWIFNSFLALYNHIDSKYYYYMNLDITIDQKKSIKKDKDKIEALLRSKEFGTKHTKTVPHYNELISLSKKYKFTLPKYQTSSLWISEPEKKYLESVKGKINQIDFEKCMDLRFKYFVDNYKKIKPNDIDKFNYRLSPIPLDARFGWFEIVATIVGTLSYGGIMALSTSPDFYKKFLFYLAAIACATSIVILIKYFVGLFISIGKRKTHFKLEKSISEVHKEIFEQIKNM